ncbi:MAG: SDR family NAD(P)-dependent oxidoreductase [Burkholderiaceae bacterium]|nr:SDR family NAD(P)-dependent oxidoreductase [Burkholderiaceae bacterium]
MNNTNRNKAVVVTGVSSGIGYATAEALIGKGYKVFGSVRKTADGERVAQALGPAFTPLLFDVSDHAALPAAVAIVREAVGDCGLAGLVNNAGVAPMGPLMHTTADQMRAAFEVNVFGLLAVTQAFLPLLKPQDGSGYAPGRIVNLSSTSGGLVFPLVGLYSMTKYAVEALSDGLRRELAIYGIKVSAIEPGPTKTPIWDKGLPRGKDSPYASTDYAKAMGAVQDLMAKELRKAKPVSSVTNAICHALEAPQPKTRYPLQAIWRIRHLLPDRALDRQMIAVAGLKSCS